MHTAAAAAAAGDHGAGTLASREAGQGKPGASKEEACERVCGVRREAERVSQRAGGAKNTSSVANVPFAGVARTRHLWGFGEDGGHEEMRVPFTGCFL